MNIYICFNLFMNYICFNLISIQKQLLSSINIIKLIWLFKIINLHLWYIILHSVENIEITGLLFWFLMFGLDQTWSWNLSCYCQVPTDKTITKLNLYAKVNRKVQNLWLWLLHVRGFFIFRLFQCQRFCTQQSKLLSCYIHRFLSITFMVYHPINILKI